MPGNVLATVTSFSTGTWRMHASSDAGAVEFLHPKCAATAEKDRPVRFAEVKPDPKEPEVITYPRAIGSSYLMNDWNSAEIAPADWPCVFPLDYG